MIFLLLHFCREDFRFMRLVSVLPAFARRQTDQSFHEIPPSSNGCAAAMVNWRAKLRFIGRWGAVGNEAGDSARGSCVRMQRNEKNGKACEPSRFFWVESPNQFESRSGNKREKTLPKSCKGTKFSNETSACEILRGAGE